MQQAVTQFWSRSKHKTDHFELGLIRQLVLAVLRLALMCLHYLLKIPVNVQIRKIIEYLCTSTTLQFASSSAAAKLSACNKSLYIKCTTQRGMSVTMPMPWDTYLRLTWPAHTGWLIAARPEACSLQGVAWVYQLAAATYTTAEHWADVLRGLAATASGKAANINYIPASHDLQTTNVLISKIDF